MTLAMWGYWAFYLNVNLSFNGNLATDFVGTGDSGLQLAKMLRADYRGAIES